MTFIIPEHEIVWQFIRSSGPGGQNVNKVATAAQLHFNVLKSTVLLPEVKERLFALAKKRINKQGELVITAQNQRTQIANRAQALQRLEKLIERASIAPINRIKTRPSRASVVRSKESKRLHSRKKQQRSSKSQFDVI